MSVRSSARSSDLQNPGWGMKMDNGSNVTASIEKLGRVGFGAVLVFVTIAVAGTSKY